MKKQQPKNKAIIFDFMRTLYNPETGKLYYGVKTILSLLSTKYDLFLVSYQEDTRATLIKELGIVPYFKKTLFVDEKTKRAFTEVTAWQKYSKTWVVGDRVESEIHIGNELGYKTIWLQQGKFATRFPEHQHEHPTHTIKNIRSLKDHLL